MGQVACKCVCVCVCVCVCLCDNFSWKSCSRKVTTEKNLVHAEVMLNKTCGWTADASESEQAKLGRMETNPHQQEIQSL